VGIKCAQYSNNWMFNCSVIQKLNDAVSSTDDIASYCRMIAEKLSGNYMEWSSQIQGVGWGGLLSLYSLEATDKIARNRFVSTFVVSDLSPVTRQRLAWKWNKTLYICVPSSGLSVSPTLTPTNQRENETLPADGGCSCAAS